MLQDMVGQHKARNYRHEIARSHIARRGHPRHPRAHPRARADRDTSLHRV